MSGGFVPTVRNLDRFIPHMRQSEDKRARRSRAQHSNSRGCAVRELSVGPHRETSRSTHPLDSISDTTRLAFRLIMKRVKTHFRIR